MYDEYIKARLLKVCLCVCVHVGMYVCACARRNDVTIFVCLCVRVQEIRFYKEEKLRLDQHVSVW